MAKQMSADEFLGKFLETQEGTAQEIRMRLYAQKERYNVTGWFMVECQMLDSSHRGERTIIPYGPQNTFTEVPNHPISPKGLASDMAVVIGVLSADEI